jgi:hypothetical protein
MKYLMSERVNGERKPDETVTAEFVQNFTSKGTREFFENLGGTEVMRRRRDGVIYTKSTSPDGETVREVVFTPLPGSDD